MKKIAIVPIDNRPICYTLIEQICAVDKDIKLFLPKREWLGGLTTQSKIDEILNWLDGLKKVDYLILSLDTIAYGGLVSSRVCPETYAEILGRVKKMEEIIKGKAEKIYAFSSIMRISNNDINEEEKEYWSQFGKRIFEYSYNLHKSKRLKTANCVINTVPKEILEDYLSTRKRNFEINKYYLELNKKGLFDTLIFSKDDTGEFGLNVEEAEILDELIKAGGMGAQIKTGADEIPLTLLARAIADGHKIGVNPVFLNPDGMNKISKYEDITIKNCVESQLELAGLSCNANEADLTFIINNFENIQGDLVLGETNISTSGNFEKIKKLTKPYFIADVNNANGADSAFVKQFLSGTADTLCRSTRTQSGTKSKISTDRCKDPAGCGAQASRLAGENFYGYCAYNTSANSIGCVVCIAVVKFLAKNCNSFDNEAFKKLMLIRFLDDWAYQAQIRKKVRETGIKQGYFDIKPFADDFKPFENKICKFLELDCGKIGEIQYELPWQRSFEIEIKL